MATPQWPNVTAIPTADNNMSASVSAWVFVMVAVVILALVVLAAMLAARRPNRARIGEYGLTEMPVKIRPTLGRKDNAVTPMLATAQHGNMLATAQRGRYCQSCGGSHGR
jgi:hypothetical protein